MMSEISKLMQKEYKTRHDWMGKVIHKELYNISKFNYTTKWYMHKLECIQKNQAHKILWDFEIQTDHLIPARRSNREIVNKKTRTCWLVDIAITADHRVKIKENKKREKYQNLTRGLKKSIKYEGDSDTSFNWCTHNSPQRFERVRNQRMNTDHPNYSIVKIGQNTKSPGDLKRLAVT